MTDVASTLAGVLYVIVGVVVLRRVAWVVYVSEHVDSSEGVGGIDWESLMFGLVVGAIAGAVWPVTILAHGARDALDAGFGQFLLRLLTSAPEGEREKLEADRRHREALRRDEMIRDLEDATDL